MTSPHQSPPRNRLSILKVLVGLLVLGAFLAAAGFGFAASQETHDPFCASCHTQPETTYVGRSTGSQPVDLASFHTGHETRCIDCHSGPGIAGRMRAELMGARNAAAWYTGTAAQPAPLTFPIADENCLKCHQEVVFAGFTPQQPVTFLDQMGRGEAGEEGGPNHWHEQLAQWQGVSSDAGRCTSCHPGHTTDGSADTGFEDPQITRQVCEGCHGSIGERRGG